MPQKSLEFHLLLGRNIPDVDIEDLMAETRAPLEVGTHSTPQPAVTSEGEAQDTPIQMEQQETDEDAEEDQGPLHLVNMVTRAQARRDEEQHQLNQQADRMFGNHISSWEDISLDQDLLEVPDEEAEETSPIANCGQPEFIRQQKVDGSLREYWVQARDNPNRPYSIQNGILVRKERDQLDEDTYLIVVLEQQRRGVFIEAHSSPLGGNFGFRKTKAKIRRHYYWPGMDKDLREWMTACRTCQMGNRTKATRAPLVPLPVAFDVVGPLPRSKKGYHYILTLMDFASRFLEATPLKRIDAVTVAEAMVATYARFGILAEILTDNGNCFVNTLQKELCKMLDITPIKISPHNPRSNRMLERWHRVLKTVIGKSGNLKEWDKVIPMALFASRDTPHTSTGLSPFEVMFGRHVRGPMTILKELWQAPRRITKPLLQYLQDLRRRAEKTVEVTAELEEQAKRKAKAYYDLRAREDTLESGEEVLVLHPAGPKGISAQWLGPYTIEERLSPVSYRLATPGK